MTVEHDTLPPGVASDDAFARGRILGGRYRLDARLGRGGMGEVWSAWDLTLRTAIAIKSILPAGGARARERLRAEVRAARKVVSPNVCRVFDLFEAEGRELISMELVEGRTLREILREESPLELPRAQEIASQLLSGLGEIHRAGLVHRDLKPENAMVTRSGRVVIMDFGLARAAGDESVSAAGTRPYMAPEQGLGGEIDGRTDLYAAGIMLAEMVAPEGTRDATMQRSLWSALRADPPRIPDVPWAPVLRHVLRANPGDRCASAGVLLRMLEETTLRVAGAEHLNPYPGLAAYTEADARFFFGRELEVEQMWRRLDRPHLQALIGPSGAGKSSFVRAGLAASAPPGWRVVVATPGARPFANLARALAPELGGEASVDDLLRVDEPEVAVALVARWRARHEGTLIVVDQFEELFAQNPPDVQARFADLLGRLPLHAGTHVLLAMRDDFFFRCAAHETLAPLFAEPFPLGLPSGPALRRALVEPARRCGYWFEDDALAGEIAGAVEGERGALPLVAFAAAQLWERRDRETGLLTRRAYDAIGGVAGALARHADATLERIGEERRGIVREIFRNLVTAQGTRAARARSELLLLFPETDRAAAGEVIDMLVGARLLTAFEVDGERRIEIVHESLLTEWPRLERWRAQDAGLAQLRDELRQAAQLWDQHGRSEDRLWTGTAHREYGVWRERYLGALTDLEREFGDAMDALAGRRKRRATIASVAAAAALVAIALAPLLWQRSVAEARRATAAELLALARATFETDRTAALAYTTESLRLADLAEARRFAVRILWDGVTETVTAEGPGNPRWFRFSPDGRWLGIGHESGAVTALPRGGGPFVTVGAFDSQFAAVEFSDDGSALLGFAAFSPIVRTWSVPGWRPLRTIELDREEDMTAAMFGATKDEIITVRAEMERIWETEKGALLRRWTADGASVDLGRLPARTFPTVRARDNQVFAGSGSEVRLYRLDDLDGAFTRIGAHGTRFQWNAAPAVAPGGEFLVAADPGGEVVLWPLRPPGPRLRTLSGIPGVEPLSTRLSAGGERLCVSYGREVRIWDLAGVAAAEPIRIPTYGSLFAGCGLDASGDWMAMYLHRGTYVDQRRASLMHVSARRVRHLRGHAGGVEGVAFSPDGRYVFSIGDEDGRLVRWPLDARAGEESAVIFERARGQFSGLVLDRQNRFLIATLGDGVWKVPFDGSAPVRLTDVPSMAAAIDAGERLLAISPFPTTGPEQVRVLDLATGQWRRIGSRRDVLDLGFDAWGRLVYARDGEVEVWDPATQRASTLAEVRGAWTARLSPDGRTALVAGDSHTILDLESGARATPRSPLSASFVSMVGAGEVALDSPAEGALGVGPVGDARRWLLSGYEGTLVVAAISPDGRWVAAGTSEGLYLWPMPDFSEGPLHELPRQELIAKLESLTNVRVAPDSSKPNGYRVYADDAAYRGWKEAPAW